MDSLARVGDLEIEQDLAVQRRDWCMERIGWWTMLLIVLAGLLGAFGHGPVSRGIAGSRGSAFWLEYERFARHGDPSTLRVHLGPGVAPEGSTRLWIDRAYLQGGTIPRIAPLPESSAAGADRILYTFRIADPSQPTAITFELEPDDPWLRRASVGIVDGPTLRFTQLVYP